jgi:hypothetical protein
MQSWDENWGQAFGFPKEALGLFEPSEVPFADQVEIHISDMSSLAGEGVSTILLTRAEAREYAARLLAAAGPLLIGRDGELLELYQEVCSHGGPKPTHGIVIGKKQHEVLVLTGPERVLVCLGANVEYEPLPDAHPLKGLPEAAIIREARSARIRLAAQQGVLLMSEALDEDKQDKLLAMAPPTPSLP